MTTRDKFDPFHQWLGIRPEEHPVDHYRLLGIVTFESDRDVIANACDRLMAHVRTFQTGPRGIYTQEVLTRLAAARACLLNAASKSTYDAVLHGQRAAAERAASLPPLAPVAPPPMAAAYEPMTAVLPPPPPVTPPPAGYAQPTNIAATGARSPTTTKRPAEEIEYVDKPSPFYLQPWFPVLIVAGVMLVGVAVWGIGLMLGDGPNQTETPAENDPIAIVPPTPDNDRPDPPDETVIRQEAGGELSFTAGTAKLSGNPRLAEQGGHSVVTEITSVEDRLTWSFRVEKPGPFRVEAAYTASAASAGGTFTLTAGGQTTKPITVRDTGSGSTQERVGFLWIRRSGEQQLVLTPASLQGGQSLMTFESLRLIPVGGSEGTE